MAASFQGTHHSFLNFYISGSHSSSSSDQNVTDLENFSSASPAKDDNIGYDLRISECFTLDLNAKRL